MNIKHRVVNDVEILEPDSKIMMGEGEQSIKNYVDQLLKQGKSRIILDMVHVPYIDSAGLGVLIRCYTSTRKSGGDLKFIRLNKKLVELLSITKLVGVFDWYDNEERALNSFAAPGQKRA